MRSRGCIGAMMAIACALGASDALAARSGRDGADPATTALDRVVADACGKSVVLLGEDNAHGSGLTLDLKVRLVRRLVDECGFSAVLFESQVYDFLYLDAAYRARRATPEQLADAVGGLWSTARGFDPLVDYLHRQATAGKVRLFGLSPMLGEAMGLYAQKYLASDVGRLIRPPFRDGCIEAIRRHANWTYDDAHPYGPDVGVQLASCANAMRSGIGHPIDARLAGAEAGLIADNLSRMASTIGVTDLETANIRDRAMAENAQWVLARLPKKAKAIVWCATVHAAKAMPEAAETRVPMGSYLHRTLGDRMMAVGFTALSGSLARFGSPPFELPALPADALERHALDGRDTPLAYLDHEQLAALGTITARPLDSTRSQSADWSGVVDGLLVLRTERPVERIRPAVPRQTALP